MNMRKNNEMFITELSEYIIARNDNKNSYKWCWGSLFGGFSKKQKVEAGLALLQYIKNPNSETLSNLIPHLNVLNQGKLKILWQSFIKEYPELYSEILTKGAEVNLDYKEENDVEAYSIKPSS